MECPKCRGNLEAKTYGRKITVHRCDGCAGLWCQPEVLLEMRKEWMSEVLDTGDPQVGKDYDSIDNVKCPECGKQMEKTSDPDQTHIWTETCPDGHGVFFDAGEFTDWKYDTFMDRLRDLVKGKRDS